MPPPEMPKEPCLTGEPCPTAGPPIAEVGKEKFVVAPGNAPTEKKGLATPTGNAPFEAPPFKVPIVRGRTLKGLTLAPGFAAG